MNALQKLQNKIKEYDLFEGSKSLKRNEYLKTKGTKDTKIYFVKKGSLRIFIEDEKEEHTIRFGYPNSIITSLDSFITDNHSDLVIQALKKVEVQVLSKSIFLKFIDQDITHLNLWRQVLEALVFQQMEREIDILTTSPVERYNRVKARSPQLFQEIPHKYIASYLRMAPETLSRIHKS